MEGFSNDIHASGQQYKMNMGGRHSVVNEHRRGHLHVQRALAMWHDIILLYSKTLDLNTAFLYPLISLNLCINYHFSISKHNFMLEPLFFQCLPPFLGLHFVKWFLPCHLLTAILEKFLPDLVIFVPMSHY